MVTNIDLAHQLTKTIDTICLVREETRLSHPQASAHLARAWEALRDARVTLGTTPPMTMDTHRMRLGQTAQHFLSQQFELEKLVDLLSTIETEAAHRILKALQRECVHEHVMKPRKLRAIDCNRCQVLLLEIHGEPLRSSLTDLEHPTST